jgi:hypothetical protein
MEAVTSGSTVEDVVTIERSMASRAGYNSADPVMKVITCQL